MDNTVQVKVVPFYDKNGKIYASVKVSISTEGKKILTASAGYKLYPMDISGPNAAEHDWDPALIEYPLVGGSRRRSLMVPVKDETYMPIMDMEWAEDKKSSRRHRCRIQAADGTTKICRGRSCYGCPRAHEDHITSETVSLDAIMENSNKEASIGDVTSTKAMKNLEEEEFIAYLERHAPKCATVYKKDKFGFTTAEIADSLGVTDRMIRYYKNRIDELRKQFEAE